MWVCSVSGPGPESPRRSQILRENPTFAQMSDLLTSESPQIKLVNEWHQGLKERDLELVKKPFHEDRRRICYPRSLCKPNQNREEWLEEFKGSP